VSFLLSPCYLSTGGTYKRGDIMKFLNRLCLVAVVGVCLGSYGFLGAASKDVQRPLKIGYVNIETIFDQYSKTEESRVEFEKEKEIQQKEVVKKQEDLRKLQEAYDKQKDVLKPEEKKKSEEEIQKLQQEFYALVGQANQKLEEKRNTLIETRVTEIRSAIKDFAEKEKYDFILSSQAIFYGPQDNDVTDQVINFLNKTKK